MTKPPAPRWIPVMTTVTALKHSDQHPDTALKAALKIVDPQAAKDAGQ